MSRKGRDSPLVRTCPNSRPSRSAPARTRRSTSIVDAAAAPPSECPNMPMRPRSSRPANTPDLARRASSVSTNRVSATRTVSALWMSICEAGMTTCPSGNSNDGRVMRVVDRDNHISVAGEVLGEAGVEPAFDAETGREENNRPAATTLQRRRVGGRVELHSLEKCGCHSVALGDEPRHCRRQVRRRPTCCSGRIPELDHQRPRLLGLLGFAPGAIGQRHRTCADMEPTRRSRDVSSGRRRSR